ncbi:class I SAM-dependent methyltransferase [Crossiella sp. SN42]|uniref:class I SAM-dependent methyltransferase n=1 Tax=Crossiella sp. SN42 TaxID=2944808 RepID=UPI00207D64A4|nr:class I SAM-dependent methyltransferase [Crossiella sp. SN42]MCO1580335.1 class I SAM-dependent methyltransferase [Crossiella sp. SN42]
MIGRSAVPAEYRRWNKEWGAPFGFRVPGSLEHHHRLTDADPARYGPFGFQQTSFTRIVEYPWAFHTADLRPGLRVVDVGGWLSGFQVVLAKAGCSVVNVDPSEPADQRWTPDHRAAGADTHAETHRRFTALFEVDVPLVRKRLQDAELAPGSVDRIFALSVLEHVGQAEARDMLETMASALAPGGLALLTIDLFLDLRPFGLLTRNYWGTNLDVRALLEGLGLELVAGDPAELLGFPEFDPRRVVDRVGEYNLSPLYPVMSQLVALRKPAP